MDDILAWLLRSILAMIVLVFLGWALGLLGMVSWPLAEYWVAYAAAAALLGWFWPAVTAD